MLLHDLLQDREINQLREKLNRLEVEKDTAGSEARKVVEENLEVKLRLSLLVRLLIAKGVFTAEEFAGLLAAARAKQ
jgi:hypothetical protein